MSAFQAALKNYKAGADVKVNPPESLKVMEAQTAPEVEAPKAPAAPHVSVAAADSVRAVAPLPETETVKRSRRTKAEMEAARATEAPKASTTSAPAEPSSPGTTTEASTPPSVTAASLSSTEALVSELVSRGYAVTLVRGA